MSFGDAAPSRIGYLDYVKGWLILLVTYGHSLQYLYYGAANENGFLADPVFQFIYMFHMPFFMLVSGFVLYRGTRFSFAEQLRKRAFSLLVPAIMWSLVFAALSYAVKRPPLIEAVIAFPTKIGILWYLPCLFLSWLVVALMQITLRDKAAGLRTALMIGACILSLLLPDTHILPYFKYVFPFYCLGHWAAEKQRWTLTSARPNGVTFGAATLVFIGCYVLWSRNSYVYVTGSLLTPENWPNLALRYVAALSGIFMFDAVIRFLWRKTDGNVMRAIGRGSLYIYILQIFAFNVYAHFKITAAADRPLLYAALPFLSFLLACGFLQAGKIIARIPVCDMVFFGKTAHLPPSGGG